MSLRQKASAFGEALKPEFNEYAQQVVRNASAMASAFIEKGYNLVSGGTDNHLMLIDLRNKGVTGKDAEKALEAAEITVNKNMVPFDTQSPFVTSGIRIGTPAITTRGFDETACVRVVELIDKVITQIGNESITSQVKNEVHELCSKYPLYDFVAA